MENKLKSLWSSGGATSKLHRRSRSRSRSRSNSRSRLKPRWKRTVSDWTQKLVEKIERVPINLGLSSLHDQFQDVVTNVAVGLEKINMDLESDIVTLSEIYTAYEYLKLSGIVVRTPTLRGVQGLFLNDNAASRVGDDNPLKGIDLYMKMENMQTTGSFKIRGCCNQMRKLKETFGSEKKLVTMSGGNYGKAFAYSVNGTGMKAICFMPETVPSNRVSVVQSFGVTVQLLPTSQLQSGVDNLVKQGYYFCKPFDDVDMIAGNASAGIELLEEVPDLDVILVCCGGGGLVSGVGAAVTLSGRNNCRVYAVEPEGASTMYDSFRNRRAMTNPNVKSIATGLCPPYAGQLCFKHCRWFVEDVLLVSEDEILQAMNILFQRGIKAEAAGCAAMAALLSNKVPDVKGKKVAVLVTGGNVTCSELSSLIGEKL